MRWMVQFHPRIESTDVEPWNGLVHQQEWKTLPAGNAKRPWATNDDVYTMYPRTTRKRAGEAADSNDGAGWISRCQCCTKGASIV